MDYQNKLRLAKEALDSGSYDKDTIEYIFPELKESEDERIRKEILYVIHQLDDNTTICGRNYDYQKWIAWLEKQGSQNLANSAKTCKVEQKSADKVKSKQNSDIEKGKWYVCDTPRYVDFAVGKAYYCPKNGMLKPNENEMARYVAKHCFHLWTIQDAKDGDVLVNGSNIFIFSNLLSTRVMGYCHINLDDGRFYDDKGKNECFGLIDAVFTPTTKEQYFLLFQKMKKAGYMWDAEKKELKKIEHKFKVGDIIKYVGEREEFSKEKHTIKKILDDCYLTIDDMYIPFKFEEYYILINQNQSWSEEDEMMLECVLDKISDLGTGEMCKDWLKSFKSQNHWKPSEEQMRVLQTAIRDYGICYEKYVLESLYNNLKNL